MNHTAADIRQTKITARIAVCKTFVIKTQQVQHSRVQIVDMDRIFRGSKTKLVGCSVDRATPDSSAGQPARETVVIMIASKF